MNLSELKMHKKSIFCCHRKLRDVASAFLITMKTTLAVKPYYSSCSSSAFAFSAVLRAAGAGVAREGFFLGFGGFFT